MDFYCPVKIKEGNIGDITKPFLIGQDFVFMTSAGWLKRSVLEMLPARPSQVLEPVSPNPTLDEVCLLASSISTNAQTIVALGGGSVLDAAKAVALIKSNDWNNDQLAAFLVGNSDEQVAASTYKLIAIPTTSGTGSEVTRWGTLWGANAEKYSVQHASLYPHMAVLDADLTLSLPAPITLFTALDALSHSMEAVWNNNGGKLSDMLATQAIGLIRNNLGMVLQDGTDKEARAALQVASTLSGMAMGTTKTALAHSISYPITGELGMPHGLACSFTLPQVAKFNMSQGLLPIAQGLECELGQIPDVLLNWFVELGVPKYVSQWIKGDQTLSLNQPLINPARAGNNIRNASESEAQGILEDAVKSFLI